MPETFEFCGFKFYNDLHEPCEKADAAQVYIAVSDSLNFSMPFKNSVDKSRFHTLIKLLKVTFEKGKEAKAEEFRLKLDIAYPQKVQTGN